MIHLRSTSIQTWLRCREEFRQHYLQKRVTAYAEIHRELGVAAHLGVEAFWNQKPFEQALTEAMAYMNNSALEARVHPNDRKRFGELKEILPDCLACYYDNVTWEQPAMIEKEWSILCPWNPEISLGGRIDRVIAGQLEANVDLLMKNHEGGEADKLSNAPKTELGSSGNSGGQISSGPVKLIDLKTASEIDGEDAMRKKCGWERSYHDHMVKDFGIGLYDWYLRQVGLTPTEITLECLMKPYPRYGKKAAVRYVPLPEVIAYRERFDQQLEIITWEIYHYLTGTMRKRAPWPMNGSACSGKYSNCAYLGVCNYGISSHTEKLYEIKEDLGVYELEATR